MASKTSRRAVIVDGVRTPFVRAFGEFLETKAMIGYGEAVAAE